MLWGWALHAGPVFPALLDTRSRALCRPTDALGVRLNRSSALISGSTGSGPITRSGGKLLRSPTWVTAQPSSAHVGWGLRQVGQGSLFFHTFSLSPGPLWPRD